MPRLMLALPLLLCGCAAYVPETIGTPGNPPQFTLDQKFCAAGAAAWIPHLSAQDVAQAAIVGGGDALAYWPINPGIPALGAAGAAGQTAAGGFDLTGARRTNVFRHCLEDVTAKDGSALLARPDN